MHFCARSAVPRQLALALALIMLGAGCSRLPTIRFDPPFGRSDWVKLSNSGVIEEPTPALRVDIANDTGATLWARIRIDDIVGTDDCLSVLRLESKRSQEFRCPQRSLEAGKQFQAEIIVYRDVGQTRIAERIRRIVEVRRDEKGTLQLVGRPMN